MPRDISDLIQKDHFHFFSSNLNLPSFVHLACWEQCVARRRDDANVDMQSSIQHAKWILLVRQFNGSNVSFVEGEAFPRGIVVIEQSSSLTSSGSYSFESGSIR